MGNTFFEDCDKFTIGGIWASEATLLGKAKMFVWMDNGALALFVGSAMVLQAFGVVGRFSTLYGLGAWATLLIPLWRVWQTLLREWSASKTYTEFFLNYEFVVSIVFFIFTVWVGNFVTVKTNVVKMSVGTSVMVACASYLLTKAYELRRYVHGVDNMSFLAGCFMSAILIGSAIAINSKYAPKSSVDLVPLSVVSSAGFMMLVTLLVGGVQEKIAMGFDKMPQILMLGLCAALAPVVYGLQDTSWVPVKTVMDAMKALISK